MYSSDIVVLVLAAADNLREIWGQILGPRESVWKVLYAGHSL